MRAFLIIAVCAALSSCAQTVSSIKSDVGKDLDAGRGYLLMAIATTESLEKLRISGERTLEFSAADLRRGSRYLLIEVPAGQYEIEQIRFSSWYQYDLNSDYWQFAVDAGKVSYVGELEIFTSGFRIKRNGLKLVNRSSYALEFMQEHFPNILAHNTISYRGPGEDGFLDYVNSTSFAQQLEK